MNPNPISPKVQNQLAMLQQIQQQLQTVMAQKTQYEMAVREATRAQEELADVPEDAAVLHERGHGDDAEEERGRSKEPRR